MPVGRGAAMWISGCLFELCKHLKQHTKEKLDPKEDIVEEQFLPGSFRPSGNPHGIWDSTLCM